MALKTRIILTGSVGLVAILFWIFLQFFIAAEGMLKWIAGGVFIIAFVAVIWDASHGGLTD